MQPYELGIIGAGNMAETIVRGLLRARFLPAGAILAAEPAEARRQQVAAELGIACTTDNRQAARCGRLMLAIKPQMMQVVLEEIAPVVGSDVLVVSIVAGVRTASIDARLGGRGRIVRVMPNTPMLVGEGVSAVAAGPRAGRDDVRWVCDAFAAGGRSVVVDEEQMDAVTAVSGSGPAYFFYLVEAMVAAGVAEGLGEEVARELASQTCLGAGQMLMQTGESPAELRRRVTSPGGTTQAAIQSLEAAGVGAAMIRAVQAAAARSRELAG